MTETRPTPKALDAALIAAVEVEACSCDEGGLYCFYRLDVDEKVKLCLRTAVEAAYRADEVVSAADYADRTAEVAALRAERDALRVALKKIHALSPNMPWGLYERVDAICRGALATPARPTEAGVRLVANSAVPENEALLASGIDVQKMTLPARPTDTAEGT